MQIRIAKHRQNGHFAKDHPIVTACRFDKVIHRRPEEIFKGIEGAVFKHAQVY